MDAEVRRFHEGLAGFDVVFLQLVPDSKRTTRTWDYFEELHAHRGESRIDLADEWLRKGYGVGYLLRNRLAAVDADHADTVRRVMDFEDGESYLRFPKVYTPSGGIHALFRHPQAVDLTRMKNHVCHPREDGVVVPWDFKLHERTMLVAPGTVTSKGVYRPGVWLPPPLLDVRVLAPTLEIYRDTKDFLRDTRPLRDRIMAAMAYLRYRAPVSIERRSGRKALRQVAQHLVGYYDLDPSLAFHLMAETKHGKKRNGDPATYTAWNQRCINQEGMPCPWSEDELLRALEDAVDDAPAYGVDLMERAVEKEFARWGLASFIEMLTHLPEPEGPIKIKAGWLYQAFLEFSGVKPAFFHQSEFGLGMSHAIEQGRLPFVEHGRTNADGRIYRGLDQNTLKRTMDRYEQQQKAVSQPA